MSEAIQLYDTEGRRLYLTSAERDAFLDAATEADRPVRTLCAVLYYTGCRISEALALTPRRVDIGGQTIIFESLKKRRRGVYRAVPVPETLIDTLDLAHGSVRPTGARRMIFSMRPYGRLPAIRHGGTSQPS
jgi:integrase